MFDFTTWSHQKLVDHTLKHYREAKKLIENKKEVQAAHQFAAVLQPYLCKPQYRAVQIDIDHFKVEILDSLEQLGRLYLHNLSTNNTYAKAAGIFQYCAAFAEKYQINDRQFFIDLAYSVELNFLVNHCRTNSNIDIAKIAHNNKIYKEKLIDIRKICAINLAEINHSPDLSLADRVTKIQQIYHTISTFFVSEKCSSNNPDFDHPSKKARLAQIGFIQHLIIDCLAVMQDVPSISEFTIMGLGSLASGRFTPWSDFEFAVLISDEPNKYSYYKDFFNIFTQLLNIKIINLGETQLRNLGIELFNNFSSGKEQEDWFWDTLIDKGFCLDGAVWYACKTPIGRVGRHYVVEKKNNCHKEITLKHNFDLIDTVKRIALLQHELPIDDSTSISWFKSDINLVQALRTTILIYGSQQLLDNYRRHINLLSSTIIRDHSFIKLKVDLKNFFLKLNIFTENKTLNTKQDIYRNIDSFINALHNYYCIIPEIGQSHINVWQIIDILVEKKHLNFVGAQHIREAIAIAFELRLNTYCYYRAQVEHLHINQNCTNSTQQALCNLTTKVLHLSDTKLLQHYYYIMLAVQNTLHRLFALLKDPQAKLYLFDCNFFEDSHYTKALVHAHFSEYVQAIYHLILARNHKSYNSNILFNLFFLYLKSNQYNLALDLAYELIQVDTLGFKKLLCNKNYMHLIKSFNLLDMVIAELNNINVVLHSNKILLNTAFIEPIDAIIKNYTCKIYLLDSNFQRYITKLFKLKYDNLNSLFHNFDYQTTDICDIVSLIYFIQNNSDQISMIRANKNLIINDFFGYACDCYVQENSSSFFSFKQLYLQLKMFIGKILYLLVNSDIDFSVSNLTLTHYDLELQDELSGTQSDFFDVTAEYIQ